MARRKLLGRYFDDRDDDDISDESDHFRNESSQGNSWDSSLSSVFDSDVELVWDEVRPYIKYALCIIAPLCIFWIISYYSPFGTGKNSVEEITNLKRYRQEVINLLKSNFTKEYEQGENTKAVLRLVGEKWFNQKPTEPYVVLIVGLKAEALADALAAIFWDLRRCEIDRIYCNEYKERQLLDNEIAQSLSKPSKMVILHKIDKLRGDTPLCLHSLCDSDHSPFPSALILLTVGISFGPHPICEDDISSHLLNAWSSDYMNEDQIRPILSRIFSFVICLQD